MKRLFYLYVFTALCLMHISVGYAADSNPEKIYTIPLIGNAFEIGHTAGRSTIGKDFATISERTKNSTNVYFKVLGHGTLTVSVKGRSSNGASVKVGFMNQTKVVNFTKTTETLPLGDFDIKSAGYYHVDLTAVAGSAEITDIVVSGTAVEAGIIYSNDPSYYYWVRRGPSCHLGYTVPTKSDITYYYNEVLVPEGEDQIGSYFMANGFGEGYFGIQVNSSTERRILFSVWSPFHTDDPKAIPDDEKIHLLKKGTDVHTGEFGNEGSGGQSYLRYNWKAGQSYKFLLKGKPDGNGSTIYTAWFLAPEMKTWKLIASFKRPKTNTYLTRFHSFLENFNPNQGYLTRQVNFNNQWVYDGAWKKVESAKLTVDATYNANQRVDATGGTTSTGYFLKMGGFFNEVEKPGTVFTFNNTKKAPKVNFSKLP